MSIEEPVVTKNNPRSKPLKGLMSASICVRKFVSARIAPARKAPSCKQIKLETFNFSMMGIPVLIYLYTRIQYQTVSLKPNFWVMSDVPATVSKQRATKASELLASATTWNQHLTFQLWCKT